MIELKESIAVDGPYGIVRIDLNGFRLGWYGFDGGKKVYRAHVSVFDRVWTGQFDTPAECHEAIRGMIEMYLEEMVS